MRYSLVASMLGAATLLGASRLAAQSCTDTQTGAASCTVATTVSATVPTIIRLSLTNFTSGTTTDFGSISASDFTTGYKDAAGPRANVKANKAWSLTVASSAATFTGTGAAKLASDLLWKAGLGGTPSTAMSTTAATLNSGSATNSLDTDIQYRLLWAYANDTPGTYSLTVNFTLSAP
jgi:hypothetical protein